MHYIKQVALTLIVCGVIAGYPLLRWGNAEIIAAVITGAAIATLNCILGYASIAYAQGKSTLTFFKAVIGGMGIRMLLMAGLLVFLLTVVAMNTAALIWSLAFFYVVFLAMEVHYIQTSVHTKQQS